MNIPRSLVVLTVFTDLPKGLSSQSMRAQGKARHRIWRLGWA